MASSGDEVEIMAELDRRCEELNRRAEFHKHVRWAMLTRGKGPQQPTPLVAVESSEDDVLEFPVSRRPPEDAPIRRLLAHLFRLWLRKIRRKG